MAAAPTKQAIEASRQSMTLEDEMLPVAIYLNVHGGHMSIKRRTPSRHHPLIMRLGAWYFSKGRGRRMATSDATITAF